MSARKGYTLLELLLVLAVIVAVAGVAVPLADVMLNSNRVTAAQDQVRAALVNVRNQAMAQGRAYTFQVMINTGAYKVEPDLDTELDAGTDEPPLMFESMLPPGAIFVRQREALHASSGIAGVGGGAYEIEVVFYPDGTASGDAVILFGVPGQGARAIRVRGLTGSIQQFDLNNPEGEL